MNKTKKVKLFHRSQEQNEDSFSELSMDDKLCMERLKELLIKTAYDQYQTEKKKLTDELGIIRNQLQNAKAEYDEVMADLMPLKWELVDKKSQLDRVNEQYQTVLINLKNARSELDSINKKPRTAKTF